MHIHQFYDEGLAHASYALIVGDQAVVVDPARDPQPYYDYLTERGATLKAIIETHPHADFASAHLEMHQTTGAPILVSGKVGADYPHRAFDGGNTFALGSHTLTALDTPGHSPDSICIVVSDADGRDHAVFTGDTLFVGDVGRPDLRESGGGADAERRHLARQMYHSLRDELMPLGDDVVVYPAHGAGSLCGKGLSDERTSTIGKERRTNPALEARSEDEFVEWLLADQPFVPQYFPYDVEINKRGVAPLAGSLDAIQLMEGDYAPAEGLTVVDTRPNEVFARGHVAGALNLQDGEKFETWLGSLVAPRTPFAIFAADGATRDRILRKAAKIGYEPFVEAAAVQSNDIASGTSASPSVEVARLPTLDRSDFEDHPAHYTIVDVRNASEIDEPVFAQAHNVPLPELRERAAELPTDKPIVVHCASGYRSAAGASILAAELGQKVDVYDLGEAVKEF